MKEEAASPIEVLKAVCTELGKLTPSERGRVVKTVALFYEGEENEQQERRLNQDYEQAVDNRIKELVDQVKELEKKNILLRTELETFKKRKTTTP